MPRIAYTLKIKGLDELAARFREAGVNYRSVFSQAMRDATYKLQNTARDMIRVHGTTYQGNLARSIQVREATHERGVVAVGEIYGAPVEFGRKPGRMPPSAPLERWAAIKLGVGGLGFVIARKIAKKGTPAQPYMEPAFRQEADYVLNQFSEAARVLVQDIAK